MSKNSVKKSYNNIAEEWSNHRSKSLPSKLIIHFASYILPSGNILDIGCGSGYPIASYLSVKGFKVTGIDFSDKLLEKAVALKLKNAQFHLVDFFDFMPNVKFDGILAFDSFFHFPIEKQKLIYDKVAGWLNKDGYLLFTHGLKEGEVYGEMFGNNFYHSSLDKGELHLLLNKAGFEIIWEKEKYIEKEMDRDLVIIAKKL